MLKWLLFIVFTIFFHAVPCNAAPPIPWWFSPTLGFLELHAAYDMEHYPRADVEKHEGDLKLFRHRGFLNVPLSQSPDHEWSLSASAGLEDTSTTAVLPDTLESFPGSLWNLRAGSTYRHRLDNAWIAGGAVSVGSPSDKPFHGFDETELQASLFLRIPHKQDNAWLFLIHFSNNREFLNYVPLPGVGYSFRPSRDFHAMVGVPFAWIQYAPFENVVLNASYFPLRHVNTRLNVRILPKTWIFGGFQWTGNRYLRADRQDTDHRLFYYEKRAEGGFRLDLAERVRLFLSGGYAFDRFYFEGKDYGDRGRNRLDINNGPFAALRVNVAF